MKKGFIVVALVLVMVMVMTVPVMAATYEDAVAALRNAGVPEDFVSQAAAYMSSHPLSAAQYDTIVYDVNAAKAAAGSVTSPADLTTAQRDAVMGYVRDAASTASLTVSVSGDIISVLDIGGGVVASANMFSSGLLTNSNTAAATAAAAAAGAPDASNPIKVTGQAVDFSALALVGTGLVALFGAALVMGNVKRKGNSAA